jgi:hypothetical protein
MARLGQALTALVGGKLGHELATDFAKIRQDFATKSLERASPGKFVETFVQCMQQIAGGQYDAQPKVDKFLNTELENELTIPEGLRVCGGRIARSIYTLRNKRNIAHKGEVDPNNIDLAYVHQAAAWIVAEMVRCASGVSMEEAGALVALMQAPVGSLVEEIDGRRIVLPKVSLRAEILILLHSHYPDPVPLDDLQASLDAHSARAISSRLSELRAAKQIVGRGLSGAIRLTSSGYNAAVTEIQALSS